MQAIRTQYRGPTDRTGSRIIASADAGRVTVPYDHALDSDGNHKAAAFALRARLGWRGEMVSGTLPDGSVAHVFFGTAEDYYSGGIGNRPRAAFDLAQVKV